MEFQMNKTGLLLFSLGGLSTLIAGYQFIQGTVLWGSFSVFYALVFFVTGWLNYKKRKRSGS